MLDQEKKVTIITPFYATEERLELFNQTYDSLISQTYDNYIWVIVNHDSAVDISDTINRFENQDKIRLINRPQSEGEIKTPSIARNEGIDYIFENEEFDYLTFLDSDDLLIPDSLERQVLLFQEGDKVYGEDKTGFVMTSFTRFQVLEDDSKDYRIPTKAYSSILPKNLYNIHNPLLRLFMWTTPISGKISLMLHKNFVLDVKEQLGYDNNSKYGVWDNTMRRSEDREFILQCVRTLRNTNVKKNNQKWRFNYDSNVTLEYRLHPKSITSEEVSDKNLKTQKRIADRHLSDINPILKKTLLSYRKAKFWLRLNYVNYIPFKEPLKKIRDKVAPNLRLYKHM